MHSIGPQKHLPADAEQVRSRARIVNMLALYNWTLNEIVFIYINIVLIDIRSGVNSVMIDSHLPEVNFHITVKSAPHSEARILIPS